MGNADERIGNGRFGRGAQSADLYLKFKKTERENDVWRKAATGGD